MKIAHARSQHLPKDRQLEISSFADSTYHTIIRPKQNVDKMVRLIKEICDNNNIGYSQDERLTLYNELKRTNFNVKLVKECFCDCSSLIASVLIHGMYNVPTYMTTCTAKDDCKKAGCEVMEFDEKKVKLGDILLKSGHIVMVVEEDKYPCYKQVRTKDLNGTLNVRETPNGKIIGSLNNLSNVCVVDRIDNWYIIEYKGVKAYASADFIE